MLDSEDGIGVAGVGRLIHQLGRVADDFLADSEGRLPSPGWQVNPGSPHKRGMRRKDPLFDKSTSDGLFPDAQILASPVSSSHVSSSRPRLTRCMW